MTKKEFNRRIFLGKCLGISTLIAGGVVISSCGDSSPGGKKRENTSGGENCDDLSGVSEGEKEKRKKVGYVTESYVSGSHCENCSLYVPPAPEGKCGGCLLFKGPVRPTGYCTQYQPKSL